MIKARKRRIIRPDRPSLLQLALFWVIVFLIPILSIRLFINLYMHSAVQTAFFRDSQVLINELYNFEQDLLLDQIILKALRQSENAINKLLPENMTHESLNQFCASTSRLLQNTASCPTVMIIASCEKAKETGFYTSSNSQFSIGKRTGEILMSNLGKADINSPSPQNKRFKQIVTSMFGGLVELPESPGNLKKGFTTKAISDKIFTCFNYYKNQTSHSVKLFLVFSENSFDLEEILQSALKKGNPEVTRQVTLLRTFPDRSFTRTDNHELIVAAPINQATLRIGSHRGQSWFSRAINSGIALKKPGKLPFASVKIKSGKHAVQLNQYFPAVNLILLLVAFTGLVIVRQVLAGSIPADSVKKRFRLAILFATLTPFILLIVTSHQFLQHFNNVITRSRMQNQRNQLGLLEMGMKSAIARNRARIINFTNDLKSLKHTAPEDIRAFLDREYGRYHDGYSFLRNDGTIIEKLPPASMASSNDLKKLSLFNDLTMTQFFNIFEFAEALTTKSLENFKKIPSFRKWQAFSGHFTDTDKNSLCSQDGDFYPAKQAESTHFSLSTHNLLPQDASDKVWAFLSLVSNNKRVVEDYLDQQVHNAGFFLNREGAQTTHIAVFRTFDSTLSDIDGLSWPKTAIKDKQMVAATSRVNSKKLQASWTDYEKNSIETLVSVKAASELPFILVATSQNTQNAQRQALLLIASIVLFIYSFVLVYLISSILSETFISPINLMVQGTTELSLNRYPSLNYSASHEFGNLIEQFNSMASGMRQRHLLDRFISKEVSHAISSETADLSDDTTRMVYRVVKFIHIRNFNALCETMAPDDSITMLNLYFSHMEPCIIRSGGQIDKYIGDAIMVSFAPENTSNNPESAACSAAYACRESLENLNTDLHKHGLPDIKIGSGIAAGMVIKGRVGARKGRQDFTIIGDAVNLAARLESISHFSENSNIMIAEAVYEKVSNLFTVSEHGQVQIKGKEKVLGVFCLKERINGR